MINRIRGRMENIKSREEMEDNWKRKRIVDERNEKKNYLRRKNKRNNVRNAIEKMLRKVTAINMIKYKWVIIHIYNNKLLYC